MGSPTTFLVLALLWPCHGLITDEAEARAWLAWWNTEASSVYSTYFAARWLYNTNITAHNQDLSVLAGVQRSLFDKEAGENTTRFDWKNFQDEAVRRQFAKLAVTGTARLSEDEIHQEPGLLLTPDWNYVNAYHCPYAEHNVGALRSEMQSIYSTGRVCLDADECFTLDPDLTRVFTSSRDYDQLEKLWKGWRDVTGKNMRATYEEFVNLQNKAAVLNGFADTGEYWRSFYEMEGFEAEVSRLWEEVKPLYKQLHAYTRRKLKEAYHDHEFPSSGHIPAHLLSNMWAQSWNGIADLLTPFPNSSAVDVTQALVDQNYDADRIFRLSESFFTSLGLAGMPDSFWRNSMIVRPEDREVVCHASAWDFYTGGDFRIKQCTDITQEWLLTTHHEMGHVQYYLQYKDQPIKFRRGANPGFHEAVGDVMSLSVSTPEHLKEIGLLTEVSEERGADLNFLMQQALEKVAFLPYGYLIDHWRWDVFSGTTPPEKYNEDYWKFRCELQGISPPVVRSEDDFDPGAKYHIPGNTPYIRYFVSYILQFQIQQALCREAGNSRPLHRCDIYNSEAAGSKLADMLKLGASVPWPRALKMVTGKETMDASALLEYFQPLYDWLLEENRGHPIGWESECPEGIIISSGGGISYFRPPFSYFLAIMVLIAQLKFNYL